MPSGPESIVIPSGYINAMAFAAIGKADLDDVVSLRVEPGGYRVLSFTVILVTNGTVRKFDCTGDRFPEEVTACLRTLEPGKILFIEDILLEGPAGEPAVVPWYFVRVK